MTNEEGKCDGPWWRRIRNKTVSGYIEIHKDLWFWRIRHGVKFLPFQKKKKWLKIMIGIKWNLKCVQIYTLENLDFHRCVNIYLPGIFHNNASGIMTCAEIPRTSIWVEFELIWSIMTCTEFPCMWNFWKNIVNPLNLLKNCIQKLENFMTRDFEENGLFFHENERIISLEGKISRCAKVRENIHSIFTCLVLIFNSVWELIRSPTRWTIS